ncbi:Topoisomerase 1-associated factor 1 [Coemansia sp. RSA 2523]|nr:Topoisomerase 1-associated factor 1 [Coemansia sp. RSA 1824]KAJ1810783.1 Topoisomerase 1-associated factor 1 [Coemansia sp. RSA 2523]KAJ2429880.1 Topoisomerase 1-associated factor 1 [Coemansia sp. RSA 2524]
MEPEIEDYASGEEQPYSDEQVSEEVDRYRRIVLSACSSLGNLQPVTKAVRSGCFGGEGRPIHCVSGTNMEYVPKDDCLSSLKDIKRYIQMDEQGDGKWVLQWLGEWQVLERDIIPIFTLCVKRLLPSTQSPNATDEDREHILKIVTMCVELFVFLTWNMKTESPEVKMRFTQILQMYKRMFAKNEVIFGLLSIAVMHLRKGHNTEREAMLVKGVLYVFRNILAIPDPLISPTSKNMSGLEVHDKLLAILDTELAVDFFMTLLSSADDRRFKDLRPILVDVIYYMFYRVPVSALFDEHGAWFEHSDLKRGGRHPTFGGVYAVSTGEGTIMPVFNAREVLRPFANLFKKPDKIRLPKVEPECPVDYAWRSVDPDAIPILRRIATVFIESCFNPFIIAMFDDLKTATSIVNDTVPRLLYIAGYFIDVSLANTEIDLGCTCAVVQTQIFGQVMRFTSTYMELKEWSSLEPAMYCIQQILLALSKMRGTKLDSLSENVLSNLFYDGDALDLFVKLCRVYRPTKMRRQCLEQIARLADTFLNTLKAYAESKSGMYIKKKIKRSAKKKAVNDASQPSVSDEPVAANGDMDEDETKEPSVPDSDGELEDSGNEGGVSSDDENIDTEQMVERSFDFARFENAFAVNEVAKSFTNLLAPPSAMEYVYPMLYRIAITCQRPFLFFKKRTMDRLLLMFNDELNFPHRVEMLDLVCWIFRQYMVVMDVPDLCKYYKAEGLNNKLAVECVLAFLKNTRFGTSVKPVITRHVVNLLPSNKDTSKNEDDADVGQITEDSNHLAAVPPVPVANDTLEDMDDDFDLDQYFNF